MSGMALQISGIRKALLMKALLMRTKLAQTMRGWFDAFYHCKP